MNKHKSWINGILLVLISWFLGGCAKSVAPRERKSFDRGWTFHLGDVSEAKDQKFNDSYWQRISLPHDWSIEGSFNKDNPAGVGGGALPGGIGWYRKVFMPESKTKGKLVFIDFDGVYMNSKVFINGHLLGIRPYGYISFRYNLTPYLKYGTKNIIAVRVDNSEQPNSRWYSGSGIYRHVWLTTTNLVYVDLWGTQVTTSVVNKENAVMNVSVCLKNEMEKETYAQVVSKLYDASGKMVAQSLLLGKALSSHSKDTLKQQLNIPHPILWSLDNPVMYHLKTNIIVNGLLIDVYDTPVGIRDFYFDAQKGFILNGKRIKIKGVCRHGDLGCLGTAVNKRAIERQLQLLKDMGCNGIRCSHNPPAPELLSLCDSMGFVVMDEIFDMWRKRKTTYDYSRYFNKWYERDLTDWIRRDRNHPSVFIWSIGNEVLEQWTDVNADTLNLQQANLLLNLKKDIKMLPKRNESLNISSLLTQKLVGMVKQLDPTRPVTAACNEPSPDNNLFRSKALDIIGYNYHESYFNDVKKNFPGKSFIVTESTSALMTRGYYRMPSDSIFVWPYRWDIPFQDKSFACSSYDNCHVPWGTTHEKTWCIVRDNDFISGLFVWTGFDYIGEPTPYGWPARSSYFGIIDLAGFPKDVYYMYQSEWTKKPVLHVFPHWNWSMGQIVDIWVYFNQADEAELYINGVSQGVRKKNNAMHVCWRVKFEPGVLKVVSRKNGKIIQSRRIITSGIPFRIHLIPDRKVITADGNDLCFVTVEITDHAGNLCPNATNLVRFSVSGSGTIAGVDNGNPISHESFKAAQCNAFYGKCMVVLRSKESNGKIILSAESEGLKKTGIVVQTK